MPWVRQLLWTHLFMSVYVSASVYFILYIFTWYVGEDARAIPGDRAILQTHVQMRVFFHGGFRGLLQRWME